LSVRNRSALPAAGMILLIALIQGAGVLLLRAAAVQRAGGAGFVGQGIAQGQREEHGDDSQHQIGCQIHADPPVPVSIR